jgi:Flp pilus assembly protein TadG
MLKKFLRNSERGQAIILIAFAIIGMVAMVGLMTDGGIMLVDYARLKRGIDAAAVASAQQFRKNFTADDLKNAATNFLKANQSDVSEVKIETCDYPGTDHDVSLCSADGTKRKLVRVTATKIVNFGFMRVVGINSAPVTATSVGEAAAIDLILVMDTSLSMSFGTSGNPLSGNDAGDDPHACNISRTCQPLENIKTVARGFVNTLFFPYDRVGIVTMTSQTAGGNRAPTILLPLNDSLATVDNALANIKVFEPPICVTKVSPYGPLGAWTSPTKGVCLNYNSSGVYQGAESPILRGGLDLDVNTGADNSLDPTTVPSSNVGGTFVQANAALTGTGSASRAAAFWVVIALISGPANATDPVAGHPDGLCPVSTWNAVNTPKCRDSDLAPDGVTPLITRHASGNINYDADDYARDMADFIANRDTGNGIVIYTIGLGTAQGMANSIMDSPIGLPESADNLLRYAAESAGDVKDASGNITLAANHGKYYYAEDPTLDLGAIFLDIAKNIVTRISQ